MTILCVLVTFFWGLGYPVLKMANRFWAIDSSNVGMTILFAGMRFFVAGLLLIAFASLRGKKIAIPRKSSVGKIALLGLLQTFLEYSFFYVGMINTTSAKSSVLKQLCVFLTVLLSPVFFKQDKITLKKIIGCLIGFAGIVVMNLDGNKLNVSTGDFLIIVSSVVTAFGYIVSKKIGQVEDAFCSTGYQQLFGGFLLMAVGFLMGGRIGAPASENTFKAVLSFAYLACESAFCFSMWFYLLQHYETARVTVYKFLTPIFGVVLSALFLAEERAEMFKITNIIALVLVCAGILIVNKHKKA